MSMFCVCVCVCVSLSLSRARVCVCVCSGTRDEHCAGGKADLTGNAFCYGTVCRCHRGWTGPDCSIMELVPLEDCQGGFRDGDGKCCYGMGQPLASQPHVF